ncbi:KIR protein [Plasmodium coatneyi]|uniref:KIR protein n=1 Tax=Plasmodium coatneyi TaxID=208452 RepID=A0A1B1E4P5_9APIC|nr:KIR protein [Plasmodium coatneyi]ANQ09994.1 KIR protein [Plasmodium coatneyi]
MTMTTTPLGEANLKELPSSKNFYSKFQGNLNPCNGEPSVQGVKDYLEENMHLHAYADDIIRAWCYIAGMNQGNAFYKDRCNFLYYWIGSKIPKEQEGGSSFSDLMNELYTALRGLKVQNGCNVRSTDDISWDLFMKRKRVHDFTHDYDTIQEQLEGHEHNCDEAYYQNLQAILTAYNAIHKDCENKSNDEYCVKFTSEYGEYSKQRELKFESKTECLRDPPQGIKGNSCPLEQGSGNGTQIYKNVLLEFTAISTAHQGSYTSTSIMEDNIITAVYSALGLMGLPTITFLLYKVSN